MKRVLLALALSVFAAPAFAAEGEGAAPVPVEQKPAEGAAAGEAAKPAEGAAAGEAAKPAEGAAAGEAAHAEGAAAGEAAHAGDVEAKPEPAGGAVHPGAAAHPADPHAPPVHAAPVGHEGGPADAHAGGEHGGGHHPTGIVNWWSWDYGPGAKDPAHKHWPPPFGFALLNFAVFAALMFKLGGKPLVEYVANRHEKIKRELDEAGRLRREAESHLAQLQEKLTGLDKEVDVIVATVRKEAEEEKARIITAAEEQAKRIQKEAERQIEAEIDRQRKDLSRAVVEAAIAQAEALLAKNLTAADQKRATDTFVAQLEKGVQ